MCMYLIIRTLVLSAVLSVGHDVAAQHIAVGQRPEAAASPSASARITMDVVRVRLSEALAEIAKQSGMRLFYNSAMVSLDATTTVRVRGATVTEALTAATRGTGINAEVARDVRTILVSKGRTSQ